MGSFYTTCSVTHQTITDGQKMYIQFMLPTNSLSHDPTIGEVFKDSFLKLAKEKGVDEAIKVFEETTSTWGSKKELAPKGMNLSDEGAYDKWIPFGPAIKGTYNDCGDIALLDDEDSRMRVKILEGLIGLPFKTILEVAQDDRWYTLGLGKYANNDDKNWRPEGISKDMPEFILHLCKKLSLTYIHASVYEEMSRYDFSPNEEGGVMKSEYEIKLRDEYFNHIFKELPIAIEKFKKDFNKHQSIFDKIGVFRCLDMTTSLIYKACIARQSTELEWFYESLMFMRSLTSMNLILQQSEYGSQQTNREGWNRIYKNLNDSIKEK